MGCALGCAAVDGIDPTLFGARTRCREDGEEGGGEMGDAARCCRVGVVGRRSVIFSEYDCDSGNGINGLSLVVLAATRPGMAAGAVPRLAIETGDRREPGELRGAGMGAKGFSSSRLADAVAAEAMAAEAPAECGEGVEGGDDEAKEKKVCPSCRLLW